jgi:hypothetical protein
MTLPAPRGNTQFLRASPKGMHRYAHGNPNHRNRPIFAAIEAHRQAVLVRLPILDAYGTTSDSDPDSAAIDDELAAACGAEIEVPGLMAVTVYVSKLTNSGHDWIGGDLIDEDAGDTEPRSFEACLIRSCAAALAQINGVTAISSRS